MIYAFIGLKGSGKTTACNYLKTKLEGVHHVNFKDALVSDMKHRLMPVLVELGNIYNMSVDELFAQKPPAMRALMQSYGTDVWRAINPDCWTQAWTSTVAHVATIIDRKIVSDIVCDDVRFLNEYEAVKSLGGVTIRLTRDDIDVTDTHQSETEQASLVADHTIHCEKDNLEKLYRELSKIVTGVV